MTPEQRQFALDLTSNCKTHTAWLGVVNFGMATLLEAPDLLLHIIWYEAARMDRADKEGPDQLHCLALILKQLGLEFTVAEDKS